MNELVLFYRKTCGFCHKVLRFMENNEISLSLKDTGENLEFRQELIALTGKTQVPCLVINGNPMHESDDIIEWLKNEWSAK